MKSLLIFTVLCLALTFAQRSSTASTQNLQNWLNAYKTAITGTGIIDSVRCLKQTGANQFLAYWTELASVSAKSTEKNAVSNVRTWLNGVGAIQLREVPSSFVRCLTSSSDWKAVISGLRVDPLSAQFNKNFEALISNDVAGFLKVFGDINDKIQQGNYQRAGLRFARFAVRSTILADKE